MNYARRQALYKRIEQARKSKVICYVTSDRPNVQSQIADDAYPWFVQHLDTIGVVKRISLILHTRGGSTMAAVSIINLIRHFCDEFEVIIPQIARSAGTLMSLGAREIVMTKQATIGPIDPSLGPISVESVQGYLDFATDHVRITDQEQRAQVFLKLTESVQPLVLGAAARARAQIQMVARKMLTGGHTDIQIERIVAFLCSESGSHDYPIHRREAQELGLPVKKPSEALYATIKSLYTELNTDFCFHQPLNVEAFLGADSAKDYSHPLALIESVAAGCDAFLTEGTYSVVPSPDPLKRAIQNTIKASGWRHFSPDPP